MLEDALPAAAKAWLDQVRLADAVSAFAQAARAVGKASIDVPERGTWGTDEVVRAALLVRAYPALTPEAAWAQGDNRERQAVLKALSFLPDPARFSALAIEACRSNVLTVFAAIACDNPYPAAHFPDLHWNQMVLKAAFNNLALARIVGLATRNNAELARMAGDFAAERRAAGRPVPADLDLVLKGTPS
jgi:hypothetical protein